jgi:hypothetical protein
MASSYSGKRFEENRGNRKLCHLNPFELFDHTRSHVTLVSPDCVSFIDRSHQFGFCLRCILSF